MRIRILALLGFAALAAMSRIEASAQYYFPPVTIDIIRARATGSPTTRVISEQ